MVVKRPVFKISRQRLGLAQIDLTTLSETLKYMKSDADRVPGLEEVSKALHTTLVEVDRAQRKLTPPDLTPLEAKFLPKRLSRK